LDQNQKPLRIDVYVGILEVHIASSIWSLKFQRCVFTVGVFRPRALLESMVLGIRSIIAGMLAGIREAFVRSFFETGIDAVKLCTSRSLKSKWDIGMGLA
jgi:hypothetical protein